jgi:hypothetical protein
MPILLCWCQCVADNLRFFFGGGDCQVHSMYVWLSFNQNYTFQSPRLNQVTTNETPLEQFLKFDFIIEECMYSSSK